MDNYNWRLDHKPQIFAINKNWDLPQEIAKILKLNLRYINFTYFSDDEMLPCIDGPVRRSEVYLVVENTPAQKLLELHFALDALIRSSVEKINLVIPYPGWLRQDRIKRPHEALTAKKVYGDLDKISQVVRFIVLHPHTTQANLSVDSPWEDIYAGDIFLQKIKEMNIDLSDTSVVASDFGAIHQAKYIARKLGTNIIIIDKLRMTDTDVTPKRLIVEGEIKQNLIFVDDIISTFGTGKEDIEYVLQEAKNRNVFIVATHSVLCGPAMERIKGSPVKKILTSNSIPNSPDKQSEKIEIVSVAKLMADAIYQSFTELGSVSSTYDCKQRK